MERGNRGRKSPRPLTITPLQGPHSLRPCRLLLGLHFRVQLSPPQGVSRLAQALMPSTGHLPWALITSVACDSRLSNNPLTAAGAALLLEGLAGNTSLTHLSLLHTGLGDEGLELLAAQLDRNHQLQELNVAYNGAGDKAALALAKAAREHPSLELLQ